MGCFSPGSYQSLADAACIHAWEYFNIRISLNSDVSSLAQVDKVLDACRCRRTSFVLSTSGFDRMR